MCVNIASYFFNSLFSAPLPVPSTFTFPHTVIAITMLENAKLIITNATTEFPAIIGAPAADDLKKICKFLLNLLKPINVPGGQYNLSGLIYTLADYLAIYGYTFDCLEAPLVAYDPAIAANTTQAVCIKSECVWMAKLKLQHLTHTNEKQLWFFFSLQSLKKCGSSR